MAGKIFVTRRIRDAGLDLLTDAGAELRVWPGAENARPTREEVLEGARWADVVLSVDSDFLHEGPGAVRYSKDFAGRRQAETPEIAAEMEAITEEAIAAEIFGSPTYVVNGERYWGQDRLSFVAQALKAEATA